MKSIKEPVTLIMENHIFKDIHIKYMWYQPTHKRIMVKHLHMYTAVTEYQIQKSREFRQTLVESVWAFRITLTELGMIDSEMKKFRLKCLLLEAQV